MRECPSVNAAAMDRMDRSPDQTPENQTRTALLVMERGGLGVVKAAVGSKIIKCVNKVVRNGVTCSRAKRTRITPTVAWHSSALVGWCPTLRSAESVRSMVSSGWDSPHNGHGTIRCEEVRKELVNVTVAIDDAADVDIDAE